MNCRNCNYENPDGARFCGDCGGLLATTASCASCGRENPGGQKFCNGCGRPLAVDAEPGRERAPRQYTPKYLAEKILTSRSALEGERKLVTILFADVKASMELAEQLDPEEWHKILDRFFQILSEGVHRFEGTINQYTGDGIMALFGAPIAHEDHARRACWAALHLRDQLRGYANELRMERGLGFAVRMGLNSGDVIVGKIGDDLRMDYTAQGHTVGLAARMQEIAEPGQAYLSDETAEHVRGYFDLEDLGRVRIKGVEREVGVFALRGVGAIRTRLELSRTRGFSKFVGRRKEMDALEAALGRAIDGAFEIVSIVGEAGVGKSRLCHEFIEKVTARNVQVAVTHCVPYGRNIPLLPWMASIRSAFGVSERDPEDVARDKVTGRMVRFGASLEADVPFVLDFLGVRDPLHSVPNMDPDARQRRLLDILVRIRAARATAGFPMVYVWEDLHWADPATDSLLRASARAGAGTRTLTVLNFRPSYQLSVPHGVSHQEIPLRALEEESTEELLADLLGSDLATGGLADLVTARAAGNPFFVEEIVQSLVESNALVGQAGAYALVHPVDEIAIPDSVQSVLAARIDRLPMDHKSVLQTAAIIGKEFPKQVLQRLIAAVGDPALVDTQIEEALEGLKNTEFLYEWALYPDVEYAFKHPLTQEVAYRAQLSDRRHRLHARLATILESEHSERLDEKAALLAHHWEQAGDLQQAARWHARAASWAALLDPRESMRHWRRVHELLAKGESNDEADDLALMACTQILFQAERMGAPERELAEVLEDGRALALRRGDRVALAVLLVVHARLQLVDDSADRGFETIHEAARLADEVGDPGVQLVVGSVVASTHLLSGRFDEAERAIDRTLERTGVDPRLRAAHLPVNPCGQILWIRAIVLSETGRLVEGRQQLDHVCDLMREVGDLPTLCASLTYYPSLARLTGDTQGALDHALEALEIADRVGSPLARMLAFSAVGEAHNLLENWEEACAALDQANNILREAGVGRRFRPLVLSRLARARAGRGDRELAEDAAREALEHADVQDFSLADAHLAAAQVLLAGGGAAESAAIEAHLTEAAASCKKSGTHGIAPLVPLARAELARLLGDAAGYRRELREARRGFEGTGAAGQVERIDQLLATLPAA